MSKRLRQTPSPAGSQSQTLSKRHQTTVPVSTTCRPSHTYPSRQTRAQAHAQEGANTFAGTSANSLTSSVASTACKRSATSATVVTKTTNTTKVTKAIKSSKAASVPSASTTSAVNAFTNAKAKTQKRRQARRGNENTAIVQEQTSTLVDGDNECPDGQPDNVDDNAYESGSDVSESELTLPSATSVNKKATSEERYRQVSRELVYDIFMLQRQEAQPEQNVSQDPHQAALDALRKREGELVANLQHGSPTLSDSTRNAYRVILLDYKKFCDHEYITEQSNRYEVNPIKALAYLNYLYRQRTPKHIGAGTTERRIVLDRETVLSHRVPIQGAMGTVDLISYVDAEEAAGKVSHLPDGKRIIYTPYSYSKIEQGYAALGTLQQLQQARSIEPNTSPPLASYKGINDSMERYAKSLVGGILRAEHVQRDEKGMLVRGGRDVSTNSNATNYYTVAEHIRCLLYAWRQTINTRSIMIREHFVLAVRHAMLLRDENVRHLDISDCSMDTFVKQPGGTQEVMALVFSMRIGKTNTSGNVQLGMAVRHADVRRCSVGAFAFYMLERFQINNEPWLDMDDPEWTAVKVLGQGEKVAMVYTTARDATLSVFNAQHVSCTNITHSGRHSGAKEAVRLKVAEEDIRTGGRWVQGTGKMHQVYLDKQPIIFALAMAGFSIKPFHLRRNEVVPPLALQSLIFPFIEKAIGAPGSPENIAWRIECEQEMLEFDPNNNDCLDKIEPYAFDPSPNKSKMSKGTALAQRSNKKHVLRLLLRLRRVILQDAAEYLYRYPDMGLSPLLMMCPDVFESDAFELFRKDLTVSLDREDGNVPADLPPNLMVALQAWNEAHANGVAETRRALDTIHNRLNDFEQCFTNQQDHNSWVSDGLDEIEKMQRTIRDVLRQPPVGSLPYFNPGTGIQSFFDYGMPRPFVSPPFQYQHPQQSTVYPSPQQPPLSMPHSHQPQPIRPAPPAPAHISQRSRPKGVLPSSFKRQKENMAAQGSKDSTDQAVSAGVQAAAAPVPVPVRDWFVRNNYPANTKDVFEEVERFDNELAERKARGLPTTLSSAKKKNLNNKRRIYEQVSYLRERNRKDKSMTKEDALKAAFVAIDAVGLPGHNSKYQLYPCVRYCTDQKHAREGKRRRRNVDKGKVRKESETETEGEDEEEEEDEE